MRIEYTRHAARRIAEREFAEEEVLAVLRAPLLERAERDGCRSAWGVVEGRGMKVVYAEDEGRLLIVTIIRQQRRPKQ